MRTWNVTWSCEDDCCGISGCDMCDWLDCCGISVTVTVHTMTGRESDPSFLINKAKQKLFDAGIDSSWFTFTPFIKEIGNEA